MIEKDSLKELAEIMKEYELTEIAYEGKDEKLTLKREHKKPHPPVPFGAGFPQPGTPVFAPNNMAPSAVGLDAAGSAAMESVNVAETSGEAALAEGKTVKAPLVGTFYVAPGVDKEPYVKVGDTVKKGQIIGIIEAMKLMNEIESDVSGVVTEILAENGKMVEFGQELIRVK
ncbi:MAG: acetyl-CoA carboxylase biotin carboxyl carrier protein [Lachnospiraceae bacterium]